MVARVTRESDGGMSVAAYGSAGVGAAGLGLDLGVLLFLHATDLGGGGARAGGHRARSHFLLICGSEQIQTVKIIQASQPEQGSQCVRALIVSPSNRSIIWLMLSSF